MSNHPVDPPGAVRQWTAADVAAARAAGRHDLISAALDAGQLADVLAGDHAKPGDPMPSHGMDAHEISDPAAIAARIRSDAAARGIDPHLYPLETEN